jgi:TatD DNase family protein
MDDVKQKRRGVWGEAPERRGETEAQRRSSARGGWGEAPDLIDIGVNLTHASFRDDREAVVERARAAGVRTLILTGTSLAGSRRALELARGRAGMYATAGAHPHEAARTSDRDLDALEALARDPACVAVGECGLDFNRDFSPRDVQERIFAAQLEIAARVGKPLFLHERDAHSRFTEILASARDRIVGGVVHCFTGGAAEVDAYLALGMHIGITGWICDERRGLHLREVVRRIPLDRLMLETDAPFLTPRTMRPRPKRDRNEPAFLPHVLDAVASALGRPAEEVARATTETARRLFRL